MNHVISVINNLGIQSQRTSIQALLLEFYQWEFTSHPTPAKREFENAAGNIFHKLIE